ncbi:acyl-CoA dehydrogenase family protein [Mycolicibacterium komossense]|uniref:Acyl-CoA/acyl-ACP dehydrogenase n=1 Tax=Mycolicibacterium komossense TaxID=1779 RepID=A0ABT3C8A1_9MYCO|nr:acyl-CoA dehydrogenase family protein [Mycolicibacterium komossense]MCV7225675.1 acyl-CoA/acyl-ACP dehydrogenase [Mycolicibacterium komossense]
MAMRETDEQRALRDAVAIFLDKRSSQARVRDLMTTDTGHDTSAWREMAEMGLLGLTLPEEVGGAGAGYAEQGIVMEEMGRALLCAPYFSTAVLTPRLLAAAGDDRERSEILPRIAAGELVVSLAYAEDSSTRPPVRVDTAAAQIAGQWSLTGQKTFVLDAGAAGLLYVLADTDSGPSIFAVDTAAAGITIAALTTIDLTRKQYRVEFADVAARLVGTPGAGIDVVTTAVDHAAVALLSEQAGGAHRAMQMGVDYARTRMQFGRAIGSFQAVKHLCADMLLEAESAISAARHVAAAFDETAQSRWSDLALAQAYCSEAFVFTAATTIQVHGGIGFTWEHPAHLYLRRARTDAQLLGPPTYHRDRYLQLKGV